MSEAAVEAEAKRIARLPTDEARRELDRVLGHATNGAGQVDVLQLDFNARLVTALRVLGVRIWDDR